MSVNRIASKLQLTSLIYQPNFHPNSLYICVLKLSLDPFFVGACHNFIFRYLKQVDNELPQPADVPSAPASTIIGVNHTVE